MTVNDIELLQSAMIRQIIAENIDNDPLDIALSKHIEHAPLIASQVKYLQRARTKLPSYYAAQCILPALSFEQSSSEQCAAHKSFSGRLCIDLTCGLGVDSLFLSRQFDRVISLERDPVLAEIARINFKRLGADNITVENCAAEDFLAQFRCHANLIYVDPDRRGADNKKLLLLQDCSPNVIELLDIMRTAADRIVIKNSPLFDVDEPFKLFGEHTSVEVVSLGGECKEVLIQLSQTISEPTIRATALNVGSELFSLSKPHITQLGKQLESTYQYLIIPDVALQKSRRAVESMSRQRGIYIETDNGYALSESVPDNILARTHEIESMEIYNPKALKQQLKEAGIKNIEILKREFPESTSEIAKKLAVKEGGKIKFAFTTFQNRRYVIKIK